MQTLRKMSAELIVGVLTVSMLFLFSTPLSAQKQENPEVTKLLADARDKAAELSRDADEMEQLGFAVFARGTTARTARGRVVERITDEIEVGGVAVRAADFVLADKTAIVFVPAAQAEQVIDAAQRIVAREAAMAAALAQGIPATSVMGMAYEDLLTRLAPSQGD